MPNYQISKKNYWTKFPKILIPFHNIILYMTNAKNHSSYRDIFIPSISGEIYTFYFLITLKLGFFFFPIQKCTKKTENKPNSHVIILKNNYTCKWNKRYQGKSFPSCLNVNRRTIKIFLKCSIFKLSILTLTFSIASKILSLRFAESFIWVFKFLMTISKWFPLSWPSLRESSTDRILNTFILFFSISFSIFFNLKMKNHIDSVKFYISKIIISFKWQLPGNHLH